MVIVNTVILVRSVLGGTDSDVALALACFGGGSMTAANPTAPAARPDGGPSDHAVVGGRARRSASCLRSDRISARASKWLWQALLPTWTTLGVAYSAV